MSALIEHGLPPGHSAETAGLSRYAETVDGMRSEIAMDWAELVSLRDERTPVLRDLLEMAPEVSTPGWDGHDGLPVSALTIANAAQFVRALPQGCPVPSVSAEADGHVCLEWYRAPDHLLSVSIDPEANLYYAAIFRGPRVSGCEPFLGMVPKSIEDAIARLRLQ